MRLLVGDDVGQAKIITTSRSIDTTLPSSARPTTTSFFPPSRTRPIQRALPVTYLSQPNLAAVFSKGGHLRIFDPSSPPHSPKILFSHTLDVPPDTGAISLSLSSTASLLTAATSTGATLFLNLLTGTHTTTLFPGPISTFSAYPYTATPCSIATAFPTRDLEIYTPTSPTTAIWKSKAPKTARGSYATSIVFLPSRAPESYRFLVATKHGSLRIYDTAVSKRPVWSGVLGRGVAVMHVLGGVPGAEVPLVNGRNESAERAVLGVGLSVVWSDGEGRVEVYDVAARQVVRVLKGIEGSVGGLHVVGEVVAGVGLGRYICVWESGKLVSRVFVKTQGCCVAVLEAEDEAAEGEEEEVKKPEGGEEDVWRDLEVVEEGRKGKRKEDAAGKTGGEGKKRRVEE